MKRPAIAITAMMIGLAIPAMAQTVRVGGQAMFPNKTIVGNAVNSADRTTLARVKAAGLVDTLNGPGPFTVFAPIGYSRTGASVPVGLP